jgi:hypothetical protein
MAPALLRSVCRASCSPAGGSRLGPADLPNSRARWPRRCAAGPGHSANFPAFIFIDTGLGSVREGRYMAPFRPGEAAAGPSHPASAALDGTPATTGTNWRLARCGDSRPPIPRARSVIQGVVENDGYALVFSALSSFRLTYSKTFRHFSKLDSRCRYR